MILKITFFGKNACGQARTQGGGAFDPPKILKHCVAILTFVETFKA